MIFSLCYYNGIGEMPVVILIDNPNKFSKDFDNLEDLEESLVRKNQRVYFVEHKGERIPNLNTWFENGYDNDFDNRNLVSRIRKYLEG